MTRPDQYADIGGFLIRHIIKLIISGPGRCFPLYIIRSVPVSPPDLGKSASFSSSRLMDWMRFVPQFHSLSQQMAGAKKMKPRKEQTPVSVTLT